MYYSIYTKLPVCVGNVLPWKSGSLSKSICSQRILEVYVLGPVICDCLPVWVFVGSNVCLCCIVRAPYLLAAAEVLDTLGIYRCNN